MGIRHFTSDVGARAPWCLCLVLVLGATHIAAANQLTSSCLESVLLFLELSVNGSPTGKVVPVRQCGAHFEVRVADLLDGRVREAPLHAIAKEGWLAVTAHPQIRYKYDANALRLDVFLPPAWLSKQRLDASGKGETMSAVSDFGALVNYDLHLSRAEGRSTNAALWSEQRLFGGAGVFSNTGVVRRQSDASLSGDARSRYIRYETAWTFSNESRMRSWTVGDVITGSQAWGTAVRLGGLRIARDFRLRPDLITYPLPEFSSQAAVPTTIDLLVDGRQVARERIEPGPFTITGIPVVNGAGEATIIATDAVGRRVMASLPFYASSDLLRPGLADYSVSVGFVRDDFGVRNFSYGLLAASGVMRYGVRDWITLEGQAELSDGLGEGIFSVFGLGVVTKLMRAGVLNASISRSELADVAGGQGWQYAFGYRYTRGGFSLSYQGTRRSDSFRHLGNFSLEQGSAVTRHSNVVSLSLSMAGIGMLGVGHVDTRLGGGERVRFSSFSYTRPLADRASLQIGATHDANTGRTSYLASLIATFRKAGNFTVGSRYDGASGSYASYTRNPPSQGGLGWNVGYSDSGNGSVHHNASLAWSNAYSRLEAGIHGPPHSHTQWADARGAFAVMEGQLIPARQIADAFVVVTTSVPNVPVRYENLPVGRTDEEGRLLVPWVASHYAARYEIDARDLPPDLRIAEVEQRIKVRRGGGATVRFEIEPSTAMTLILTDAAGVALPVGSTVLDAATSQSVVVGYDGIVYFENAVRGSELIVTRSDGGACSVDLTHLQAPSGPTPIGPLVCE